MTCWSLSINQQTDRPCWICLPQRGVNQIKFWHRYVITCPFSERTCMGINIHLWQSCSTHRSRIVRLDSYRSNSFVVKHSTNQHTNNIIIAMYVCFIQALAWCPWRRSVIASGGGSADGYIRLWQIHTGEKLGEIYTKSQVIIKYLIVQICNNFIRFHQTAEL